MACNNLGLWASGVTDTNICSLTPSITLYGDSITVGETIWSIPGCLPSDANLPDLWWSNGTDYFHYDGGIQQISSVSACTIPPTPSQTETPTPTPTPTNTLTPTLTPTNTSTPTVTPTYTPTPTLTPSSTPSADFCIYDTITYDGNYVFSGVYNGYSYYSNVTLSTGVIFYSSTEDRWCLAGNLGDPCVQFGSYNSMSSSPDLDDTVMYIGTCITTTTTTSPCSVLDFTAVFDCYIPPTPSITPTISLTPTLTPTPTSSDPCGGRSMSANIFIVSSSATPTLTPTPTPTPIIERPCNFSGEVIFNSINEVIQCASSKKFTDCFTGVDYYTSDSLLVSGTTSPEEGYVYNAIINGQGHCVIFEGLVQNISGVDVILLTNRVGLANEGSCLNCNSMLSQTPTQTPTPTPTPTPTASPCVSYQYRVTNLSPAKISAQYVDCITGSNSITVPPNSSVIVCSTTLPTSNNPQNAEITPMGLVC